MLDDNLTNNAASKEFSVSEISSKIKYLLENNFGFVRIKGEISGLKIASSGHGYFSLKDTNAVIAATCWRHNLSRINFKLEEGLEVVTTGKITAYAGQSKYQISVDRIEPSGVGAFIQILKERRAKLEKEGLFDKESKKKIPFIPQRIGIITSITGAVIKDIIHRISDRFPTHLIVWPVSVQGSSSAEEISKSLDGFNKLAPDKKPDLIIIARGGGSIEDLWSFNEEIVVRSIYNSEIPIISAVGHETDYTLTDLAADLRAPTPTAAAEFAVPVMRDIKHTVDSLYRRLCNKLIDRIKYQEQILVGYDRALEQVTSYVNNMVQKSDDLSFRLKESLSVLLKTKQILLQHFSISRLKPAKILKYKHLQYQNHYNNLLMRKSTFIDSYNHKLEINSSLLESLSYKNVLKRGYAMVKSSEGNFISTIKSAKEHDKLSIKMQDGEMVVNTK